MPPLPAGPSVYLGNPAFEDALSAELRQEGARPQRVGPGVLLCAPGPLQDPCFARQVWPHAQRLRATGPSAFCEAWLATLPDEVEHALYLGEATWSVVAPDFFRRGSGPPGLHPLAPLADAVAEVWAQKITGRARKRGISPTALPARFRLSLLLTEAGEGFASVAPLVPDALPVEDWPSRFPAGRAPVLEAFEAPSSAYKKLCEAFAWLGAQPGPGDVALDLGAAPGGWSAVALAAGARVIAMDRADLDPRLARNPRITHLRKDAFEHAPLAEASWLLCDVIDRPEKSFALIERALAEPGLRGLVVTLKLKRPVDVKVLRAARALLRRAPGCAGRAKNLLHNKCEITVMMRRDAEADGAVDGPSPSRAEGA